MKLDATGRAPRWLAALGLVVAASIAVATAPQEGTLADPFVRTGVEGRVLHTRTVDVEVTGVRLTEQLNIAYDETRLDTDGVWVVVDLIVTSNVDSVRLSNSELHLNGVAYGTYTLPNPGMGYITYGAGVPVRGPLVFELPSSALQGGGLDDARVYLQAGVSVQLDDIPEVIVDLSGLEVARSEIIDEAVVVGVR
jgi:hypothetical protein